MKKETAQLLLEVIKLTMTLLMVCGVILISIDVLCDTDIFSIRKVIALAVLCEAVCELRSAV